jgi:hypothetical protein
MKKQLLKLACYSFGFSQLLGCTQSTHSLEHRYQQAVKKAAFVKEAKIATQLIPITATHPNLVWNADKSKLLVLTWKQQSAYEKFIQPNTKTPDNPDFAIWVTTAPQVQQFCQNFVQDENPDKAGLDLRLKQYLGLDASWNYDVFVEMWVSPQDLFRPCVDPQIDDQQCELQFGKTLPQVKNIADYASFYKNLYFKSFRASGGVPWTGLGYTYDWGNPQTSVGASEFIVVPNAAYDIKRVVPTQDYCAVVK